MTRPYAEVIGDPIAHSKSPVIHNFWLSKLGIEAEYRATQVRPDELKDYLANRREDAAWRGSNVTLPHKEIVGDLIETMTPDARRIGALNTIRRNEVGRIHGRNSDVHGIWRALDSAAKRSRIVLIGAGGAARAAAFAVSRLSPEIVYMLNRNAEKSRRLIEDFRLPGELRPFGPLPPADIIINASALGMVGKPDLPVTLENQTGECLVFDMVYAPLTTALLTAARNRGLSTADGLVMLIAQAAEAFSVFFRCTAPREYDAELRMLLTT